MCILFHSFHSIIVWSHVILDVNIFVNVVCILLKEENLKIVANYSFILPHFPTEVSMKANKECRIAIVVDSKNGWRPGGSRGYNTFGERRGNIPLLLPFFSSSFVLHISNLKNLIMVRYNMKRNHLYYS